MRTVCVALLRMKGSDYRFVRHHRYEARPEGIPPTSGPLANESVSKSAMCFWGLCQATISGSGRTTRPDATGLLNKADGKNRESENPERYLCSAGAPPTVALEHLRERFETENRQRGGEVAQVFVNTAEMTRPRKVAPRGLALRREPQELADGNMAPHMILSLEPFSVRQS